MLQLTINDGVMSTTVNDAGTGVMVMVVVTGAGLVVTVAGTVFVGLQLLLRQLAPVASVLPKKMSNNLDPKLSVIPAKEIPLGVSLTANT